MPLWDGLGIGSHSEGNLIKRVIILPYPVQCLGNISRIMKEEQEQGWKKECNVFVTFALIFF